MTLGTAVRPLFIDALQRGVFPGAVIEVGTSGGPIWQEAFGKLRDTDDASTVGLETIYDLASLTKVIATTSLVMRLVEEQQIALDDRVADRLPAWPSDSPIRVRHLLDHSSGLPAHARLWEAATGRAEYERAIARMQVEAEPGARSVYSDLGFILLGFIVEDAAGLPLGESFDRMWSGWGLGGTIQFLPPIAWRDRIAPTEFDPWRKRELVGEVHDENAAALGGAAGHAGLFGTADAVGAFARLVLRTRTAPTALGAPDMLQVFTQPTGVSGSSRALGWDTMRPTSSCGRRMSPRAIGHVGFTGTSLWIDLERDVYVVLLTNRVHPTRENTQIQALRPALHDAIMATLGF